MNEIYERSFTVASTEVDSFGNCTPTALLGYFQDAGTEHTEQIHIDRDRLVEQYHATWMLVRVYYRLSRPLKMDEVLTVRTWHRGASGLTVYRDFDLFVNGEQVGEAVSAWVVVDIESRSMLRVKNLENISAAPVPEQVKDKQLKLIRAPQERSHVYTKTVRYSDLDVNGHMNSTKYANVMLDALTPQELQGRYISEMQLNYSKECLYGETVDICRRMGESDCYIDGCGQDGSRRFEAILQFQKECGKRLDEGADSE